MASRKSKEPQCARCGASCRSCCGGDAAVQARAFRDRHDKRIEVSAYATTSKRISGYTKEEIIERYGWLTLRSGATFEATLHFRDPDDARALAADILAALDKAEEQFKSETKGDAAAPEAG